MAADFTVADPRSGRGMPDPAIYPGLFDGVLWRRAAGYVVDLLCIAAIGFAALIAATVLTVMSFGLLAPGLWFLLGLVPLAYHTLLVSGPHGATIGMRVFDVHLRSYDGERPVFLQALAHAALFYLSVAATGGLILLFPLFNRRKRTLHDVLAGMLMVRRPAPLAPPVAPAWRR